MSEVGAIAGFTPDEVVGRLVKRYTERLEKSPLSPEDRGNIIDLMTQFGQIASQLIHQQQEIIQVTGKEQDPKLPAIAFDAPRARQSMFLFCDGMYYTLIKCHKMKIPKDLHVQFAQEVAQQIFEDTKDLVLIVHHHDPQMAKKDQVRAINKAAHEALQHFIGEYKKVAKTQSAGGDG